MKYILSKEEYERLTQIKKGYAEITVEHLQVLCVRAAENIPVKRHWDKEDNSPWGCILSESMDKNPGYCDECPVYMHCPHPSKHYSK